MLTATLGSADVAVRNRAILGEGPIWDQRAERLIRVDGAGDGRRFEQPRRIVTGRRGVDALSGGRPPGADGRSSSGAGPGLLGP